MPEPAHTAPLPNPHRLWPGGEVCVQCRRPWPCPDAPPDIIVYGSMAKGERTISGGTYPMSGWGWSCATCKQSGFGYATEADAEEWAERHAC